MSFRIDEFARQLRWAALWEFEKWAASLHDPSSVSTPGHDEHPWLSLILEAEMLPGVRQLVLKEIPQRWSRVFDVDVKNAGNDVESLPSYIVQKFCALSPEYLPANASEDDIAKVLARTLRTIGDCELPPLSDGSPIPGTSHAILPDWDIASHWWRTSLAFVIWQSSRPTESDAPVEVASPSLQLLADQCGDLIPELRTRQRIAKWCARDPWESGFFTQLRSVIEQCHTALALNGRRSTAGRELVTAELNGILSRLSTRFWRDDLVANWPPVNVARLLLDMVPLSEVIAYANAYVPPAAPKPAIDAATGQETGGFSELRYDVQCVVSFAHIVIDFLDRSSNTSKVDWDTVTGSINELLARRSGPPCKAALLREEQRAMPQWFRGYEPPVRNAAHSVSVVEQTGLAVECDSRQLVIRTARIVEPPRAMRLLSPIRLFVRKAAERHLELQPQLLIEALGCLELSLLNGDGQQTIREWWQSAELGVRSALWQVSQYALLMLQEEGCDTAAMMVLTSLEDEGFYLQSHFPDNNHIQANALRDSFFLLPARLSSKDSTRCRRGFILEGPDGTLFGPSVWLRVKKQELMAGLAPVFAVANELLQTDRDAQWYPDYQSFAALCDESRDNSQDDSVTAMLNWLTRVHARFRQPGLDTSGELRMRYRDLVVLIYKYLTNELTVTVRPALVPTTGEFALLTSIPQASITLRSVSVDADPGAVQSISAFTTANSEAIWDVSIGTTDHSELMRIWVDLPPAPRYHLSRAEIRICDDLRTMAWRSVLEQRKTSEFDRSVKQLKNWLVSEPGGCWFDKLVRDEIENASSVASRWLTALRRGANINVLPEPGRAGREPLWPMGTHLGKKLKLDFHETVPLRHAFEVTKFATEPDAVEAKISLGMREQGSAVDRAFTLIELLKHLSKKGRTASTLLVTAKAMAILSSRELLGEKMGDPAEVAEALPGAIDELAASFSNSLNMQFVGERMPSEEASKLQSILDAVRDWCDAYNIAITPSKWSFTAQLTSEQLTQEESRSAHVVFMEHVPALGVVVKSFGLSTKDDSELKPCQLIISAGQVGRDYDRLIDALQTLRGEESQELLRRAQSLPQRKLEGDDKFGNSVQTLFEKWYSKLPSFCGDDAADAARVDEALLGFIRSLGFAIWKPDRFEPQDLEERLEVVPPKGGGELDAVLRPALYDDTKRCRVKAQVRLK